MLSVFTTTVPLVAVAEVTVKSSLSISVSLARTSITTEVSLLAEAVSLLANGASLTALTVIVTVAASESLTT